MFIYFCVCVDHTTHCMYMYKYIFINLIYSFNSSPIDPKESITLWAIMCDIFKTVQYAWDTRIWPAP